MSSARMTLDIDFIRSHFPGFQTPDLSSLAFFESAAGSLPCSFVLDRLERFYRERKVQPAEAYQPSAIAQDEMDEARTRLAALISGIQIAAIMEPTVKEFRPVWDTTKPTRKLYKLLPA